MVMDPIRARIARVLRRERNRVRPYWSNRGYTVKECNRIAYGSASYLLNKEGIKWQRHLWL